MNYSLDMQCVLARARLYAHIENRVVEAKGAIAQNFAEARKRLLPDGVMAVDLRQCCDGAVPLGQVCKRCGCIATEGSNAPAGEVRK